MHNIIYKRVLLQFFSSSFISKINCFKMSTNVLQGVDLLSKCKEIVPELTLDKHKGQAGRIGVFGGSIEYTGAPYYAAITALKTGADLVYIFCMKEASTVIKSYSPELIVFPFLNENDAFTKIKPWLERLHVVLVGPGLGRDLRTFKIVKEVIEECNKIKKPLVIDADGLFFLKDNLEILDNYSSSVILTPNLIEFSRLINSNTVEKHREKSDTLFKKCPNLTILCKGPEDIIFNSTNEVKVTGGGSGRRSGGQGDLLSGCLSTLLAWALNENGNIKEESLKPILAAYSACKIVRRCNELSFKRLGRSMTALDMIQEVHTAFEEYFQTK